MARVVVVWNEHPTEAVGGFHARKVAKLLSGFGHDVVLKKIRPDDTIYGIVKSVPLGQGAATGRKARLALERLLALKDSVTLAKDMREKHGADFAFNFHSRFFLPDVPPEKFTVGVESSQDRENWKHPVSIILGSGGKHGVVELPAWTSMLGEKRVADHEERVKEILAQATPSELEKFKRYLDVVLTTTYHAARSRVANPRKNEDLDAVYCSEAVSKIVASKLNELMRS